MYLDEDAMRRSLVFGLRARSVDALTALEAEMVNRDDQEHLAGAAASGSSSRNSNVTQPARGFGGS